MALTPHTVCLFLSLVVFILAAVWVPPSNFRVGLVPTGLALLVLALLLAP